MYEYELNGRIKSIVIAALSMAFYYVCAVVINKWWDSANIPIEWTYWQVLLFLELYLCARLKVGKGSAF